MNKKVYEVVGFVKIEVRKRVKAKNEENAIELASEHFGGLYEEWNNNSIFLRGQAEELYTTSEEIEWTEAYIEDNDYDTNTEDEEDE